MAKKRVEAGVTLEVAGLRELKKALKDVEDFTPKEITEQHKKVAQLVVPEIKARADARPRKTRTGQIAASVRASGDQSSAKVTIGNRQRTDAYVQEFGGRAPLFGDRSKWNQVRPANRQGYFVYPAIRAKSDVIGKAYLEALDEVARKYFAKK